MLQRADGGGGGEPAAADVTDNAGDQGQLIPMIDAAEEVCGEAPEQVLADANYCNERDLWGAGEARH